jgi:putative acetyltransferase
VRIEQVDWDDPASITLRTAQQAEIAERYGTPDSEPGPKPTAADISAFFVAYSDDGTAVGCGGLRQLDPHYAEIKRMFVTPEQRGTGSATEILAWLESYARERGWQRLVLETGIEQPDAMRFYSREGYTRIPNFGYYVDSKLSRCYEKILVEVDPALDTLCDGCE